MALFAIKSWERTTEDYVWNVWRRHPFLCLPNENTCKTTFEDDDGLSHSANEAGIEEEDKEEDVTSV